MKLSPHALAVALAAFAGLNFTHAATTVATDPVGFVTLSVTAGKTKAVAPPLTNALVYHGAVTGSSVGASTITTTGAGWTSNAYGPYASNPNVVRFTSGALAGQVFHISSNTNDTLTVTDFTTAPQLNDQYDIVPVDTLASLFGTNAATAGFVTNSDVNQADQILIRGTSGWLTYYNDGTKWLRSGTGSSSQNNVGLSPDRGFLLYRRGATDLKLTFLGNASVVSPVAKAPGSKITLVSNQLPVATSLSKLGFQGQPNWVNGTDPASCDVVQLRGSTGWLSYFYDGSKWLRVGSSQAQDPAIAEGTSVLVVRYGAGDVFDNQTLPYNLSL